MVLQNKRCHIRSLKKGEDKKKITKITEYMEALIKLVDSQEDKESKMYLIEAVIEFTINSFYGLSFKGRCIIGFTIVFKMYKFKHIQREIM